MRVFSAIALTSVLTLSVFPAAAACFFISLREFHVTEAADPFAKGNFSPLIALEPGRLFPLAPELMVEAPHANRMQGRRYYIPRHLIDDAGRFSLRMTMIDHDKDTPNDLVLPQSERLVDLISAKYEAGLQLVTVRFMPFADRLPPQSNIQEFTFELERRNGLCDSGSEAGLNEDRRLRRENELRRLLAQVRFYDSFPTGGQDYLPYRFKTVEKIHLPAALASALDMARVNAHELLALGQDLRELRDAPDFDKAWVEYTGLVHRLLAQSISIHYQDDQGVKKQSMVPSLAFHPAWKNLGVTGELPNLPPNWGITAPPS